MARVETIIVGGGIQSAAPFTIGAIPVVVNSDPPTESDSIMTQQAGTLGDTLGIRVAGELVVGATAAAANRFGVAVRPGEAGDGFSSFYALRGLTGSADLNSSVVIGNTITASSSGAGALGSSVIIGDTLNVGATSTVSRRVVVIGASNTSANPGTNQVLIGYGLGGGSGIGVLLLSAGGSSVNLSGTRNQIIALKVDSGLGGATTIAHDDIISIGGGASSANNQFIIGGQSIVHEFAWGLGVSSSNAAVSTAKSFHTTDAVGTNIAAGSLTIRPGAGTGNAAAGGQLILGTHLPGAGGAAAQTFQPVLTLLHNAGGAGVAKVRFDGVTNGAAAAVGTLNNAPAAGDPTFWMPVDIGGVVKFIPCW